MVERVEVFGGIVGVLGSFGCGFEWGLGVVIFRGWRGLGGVLRFDVDIWENLEGSKWRWIFVFGFCFVFSVRGGVFGV